MTRKDLENLFREQFEYFFNCGPALKDRNTYASSFRNINLTFRTPNDDGNAQVDVTYLYHTRRIIFDIILIMDNEQDKTSYWASNIPETEEEYFQESTIKDMYFNWEFYQYLEQIFKRD